MSDLLNSLSVLQTQVLLGLMLVVMILAVLLLYVFSRVITWGVLMSVENFRRHRWRRFMERW